MGNFLRPVLLWQSGSQVSWTLSARPFTSHGPRTDPNQLVDSETSRLQMFLGMEKKQGLEGAIALDSDGKASKCAYVCISVCIHIHIHVHIHVHIHMHIHLHVHVNVDIEYDIDILYT